MMLRWKQNHKEINEVLNKCFGIKQIISEFQKAVKSKINSPKIILVIQKTDKKNTYIYMNK